MHIDGYVAVVAHTFPVPASTPVRVPFSRARSHCSRLDRNAAQGPRRRRACCRPHCRRGRHSPAEAWPQGVRLVAQCDSGWPSDRAWLVAQNTEITDIFAKVAADFKVSAVQGVLSHSMSRFTIDGENVCALAFDAASCRADPGVAFRSLSTAPIPSRRPRSSSSRRTRYPLVLLLGLAWHRVTDTAPHSCVQPQLQVYAIDVVMSSGEGKPKESDDRTTIFKARALVLVPCPCPRLLPECPALTTPRSIQ